ncbi:hypothetical protein [Solitalea lacus]|nr:hypothetical protein [Solitalea lacus]
MDAFSLIYELNFHKLFEYGTRFIKDEEIVKDSIQDLTNVVG